MKNTGTVVKKLADLFRLLEDIVAIGGMVTFGVFIMYEIVVRALGRSGLPWLQEFSQYMFIISVFIGSSRAVEHDDHMVMDILYRTTPVRFHGLVQCLVDFFMILLSLFLLLCTYNYWSYLHRMGTSTQTISGIKMSAVWLPIVFCMGTMAVRHVFVFLQRVQSYVRTLRGSQPAEHP